MKKCVRRLIFEENCLLQIQISFINLTFNEEPEKSFNRFIFMQIAMDLIFFLSQKQKCNKM